MVMGKRNIPEVERIVEAALFLAGKPMKVDELKKFAECNRQDILNAIDSLKKKYAESSIEIRSTAEDVYEMNIKDKYLRYVEALAPEKEFSPGTLKTLAYIAYKTPVKQSEVVKVRGNRAYEQISELVKRGFVSARKKGHTRELRVTKKLLKYFGLKSESELKKYFRKIDLSEDDVKKKDA